MTNEELSQKIDLVLAAINGAAATANQASAGANAGVAGARTHANTEQASNSESMLKAISQHIDSDIGIPEATSAHVLSVAQQNQLQFQTMITQLQTHIANLNQLSIQSIANNQNQSNLNNTLAIDRAWNVNATDAQEVNLATAD